MGSFSSFNIQKDSLQVTFFSILWFLRVSIPPSGFQDDTFRFSAHCSYSLQNEQPPEEKNILSDGESPNISFLHWNTLAVLNSPTFQNTRVVSIFSSNLVNENSERDLQHFTGHILQMRFLGLKLPVWRCTRKKSLIQSQSYRARLVAKCYRQLSQIWNLNNSRWKSVRLDMAGIHQYNDDSAVIPKTAFLHCWTFWKL